MIEKEQRGEEKPVVRTVPGKPSSGATGKEQLLRGAGRGYGEEDTEVARDRR